MQPDISSSPPLLRSLEKTAILSWVSIYLSIQQITPPLIGLLYSWEVLTSHHEWKFLPCMWVSALCQQPSAPLHRSAISHFPRTTERAVGRRSTARCVQPQPAKEHSASWSFILHALEEQCGLVNRTRAHQRGPQADVLLGRVSSGLAHFQLSFILLGVFTSFFLALHNLAFHIHTYWPHPRFFKGGGQVFERRKCLHVENAYIHILLHRTKCLLPNRKLRYWMQS